MAKGNGRLTAELDPIAADDPIDAVKARAALDKDKERRAQEFSDVLKREGDRLRCDLVAVAEIVGNQVGTAVRIVPRQ